MPLILSLYFLGLLLISGVLAVPKNITIDDTFGGDAKTSLRYSPTTEGSWTAGNAETHGRAVPDMARVHDGTWHDTTQDTQLDKEQAFMELSFEGTGVYIYNIVANNLDAGTGVKADYTFLLDNGDDGRYTHNRDGRSDPFYYAVLVYSRNNLPFGKHTLRVVPNGGPGVEGSTLLLFDYAVITTDDGTSPPTTTKPSTTTSSTSTSTSSSSTSTSTSSSSSISLTNNAQLLPTSSGDANPTPGFATQAGSDSPAPSESPAPLESDSKPPIGAIVGGVLGAVVLALAVLLFVIYRRRQRRAQLTPVNPFTPYQVASYPSQPFAPYQSQQQFTPFHDEPSPLSSPEMRPAAFDNPPSDSMVLRPLRLPYSDTSSSIGPRSETPASVFTPPPGAQQSPFSDASAVAGRSGSHNHSGSLSSQNAPYALRDQGHSVGSSSRTRDSLVQNLREEVEELRRRMQMQNHMSVEPPPRYEEAQ